MFSDLHKNNATTLNLNKLKSKLRYEFLKDINDVFYTYCTKTLS